MLSSLRETVGRASAIPAMVNEAFEAGCIHLLTEAFKRLKKAGLYNLSTWNENLYTAHFIIQMEAIRDEEDINLQIDPECNQYYQEILEGKPHPDRSPRIDIRIKGGWARRDIHYAIEAKILVETSWGTRKASALNKRYIETGIEHFINGRYSPVVPRGCMAGYVIQGEAFKIMSSINTRLRRTKRRNETLQNQHTVNECEACFHSTHVRRTDGKSIRLYHVLMNFSD